MDVDVGERRADRLRFDAGSREGGEDPLRIADFISGRLDPSATIPLYGEIEFPRHAAFIVGPYGHTGAYRAQSFDWVAKAKALLAVFRRTILVLPEECPEEPHSYWRTMLRTDEDDLMLLKISSGKRADFLADPVPWQLRRK